MKLKASRLKVGSTIGVIAPAGYYDLDERLIRGIAFLEEKGFNVVTGNSIHCRHGYLAGTDSERVADLNRMFSSPEIDAIFCLRGGYGTLRLLDLLDYPAIQDHPKIFVGYSDITALHLALAKKTGLVTFHGAMVGSDLGAEASVYTRESLIKALGMATPLDLLVLPEGYSPVEISPGEACGELIGGNLSLIISTLGTPYEIETEGKILFLEEINEEPYRVDRMLTHMRLSGKLDDLAGIVIGECVGCQAGEGSAGKGFTLLDVFADRLGSLGVPCVYGLPMGHGRHKATFPLGVKVSMNASTGVLTFMEEAVL